MTGRVTASVGAVILRDDKVLLVRRARPPFQGHWSIPGGKIEHGEPLHEALKREVKEETGVEITIEGLLDVFEALPDHKSDKHFIMIDFVCRYAGGNVQAGDDAMEAQFVTIPEALSRLAWDKTRTAIHSALSYMRQKKMKADG